MGTRAITSGICVLLIACCSGCRVDQQKEVGIYRQRLEGHAPIATFPAAQPIEAGERLSLPEAMALASRDNELLALQGETYLQALIAKARAFANFLPTISFAPTFLWNEPFTLPKGVPDNMFPAQPGDIIFGGQGSVFNLRDVSQLNASKLTVEQQRLLLLDRQSILLLEVAQTYYTILQSESSVAVLRNTLEVQEKHVGDTADRLKNGLVRQLDLEQAKAQAARTRVQLTDAETGVLTGRVILATLLGVPYVKGRLSDEYPTPSEATNAELLMRLAREHRYDLQAADQAVLAARQDVNTAFRQYYPSISFNVETFAYRGSFPQDSFANALVSAHLPLFSGGRIHADVRAAWSRFRQAGLARSFLEKRVAEQVEIARIEFEASLRRISELGTEVAATHEALRIANASYAQGLAINLDRLDAQDRALSAELRLSSERYNKSLRYLNLLRVTGRLDGPNAGSSLPRAEVIPMPAAEAPAASAPNAEPAKAEIE